MTIKELKLKLIRADKTMAGLAKYMGLARSGLYWKIHNNWSERDDAKLAEFLKS